MTLPPLPLSLTDRIKERYAAWHLAAERLPGADGTDPELFLSLLQAAEPMAHKTGVRLYPSSFEPEGVHLRGFPQPAAAHWLSLERALRTYGASTVTTRLPPFWQLEPAIHAACRNVGAPLFVGEPENVPVGAAAVFSTGIDAVIAETSEAALFAGYLRGKEVALPHLWFLVHRIDAPVWTVPGPLADASGLVVTQEVHLMPGIPLFIQCPILAGRKEALFHVSEAYLCEPSENALYVTSLGDDPLPLLRLSVPVSIKTTGRCACGKENLERL